MDLVKEISSDGKPLFNGCFSYDSDQAPIPVFSDNDSSRLNSLILVESGMFDDNNGRLRGEYKNGVFEGWFEKPRGEKVKFRLEQNLPEGSLNFSSISFDTIFRATETGEKPNARFSWFYLIAAEKWLQDSLLTELHGDSLFRAGKGNPRLVFQSLGRQYAADYRQEVAPLTGDPELTESLNYDLDYGMEVLFNRNHLLSIAFSQYQYSGGAHGMLYSRCLSFDLNKKQKIRLSDVFRPSFQPALKAALNQAARKKYRTENLSDVLLVEEIEPNDNFFLTGKGICFVFHPYEIGPYAMGEQSIFLSYSELSRIVK